MPDDPRAVWIRPSEISSMSAFQLACVVVERHSFAPSNPRRAAIKAMRESVGHRKSDAIAVLDALKYPGELDA